MCNDRCSLAGAAEIAARAGGVISVISWSAPINKPRADNCICDQRHVGRDSGVAPTPAHGEPETHDIKLKYTTHGTIKDATLRFYRA